MKSRFRLFRRAGGLFYLHDAETGKQESLRTRVKREAQELVMARNAAIRQPLLNRTMARAYLSAQDPQMLSRTWTAVFAEFATHGRESSRERTTRAAASKNFDVIRNKPILETTADDFLAVLNAGGTATNNYLRRFHNLALDLGWLLAPVLPKRAWPAIRPKRKPRALTRQEYDAVIQAEGNEERRHYYQFLWETGAAQTDAANSSAANIDWDNMVLVYERKKLQEDAAPCRLRIGGTLEALLR
jgi:integrase